MKHSLTAGLEAQRATEIETEFQSSAMLRRRLVELLEGKQTVMLHKRRKEDAYDSSNWAYLQADGVGYERAISEIIALIS